MRTALLSQETSGHIRANAHSEKTQPHTGAAFPAVTQLSSANAVAQLAGDPADKNEVLANHARNQNRVYGMINNALLSNPPSNTKPTREKLLKNTAELFRDNFANLFVLTRTHVTPTLREDGKVAYFDHSVRYPAMGGDYNDAQDQHVYMLEGSPQGHADHRGEIRLYDPADYQEEDLKTFLIHEMQHQVDFHRDGEAYSSPGIDEHATANVVNGYQTEFRAYWIGGLFRTFARTGVVVDRLGFSSFPARNEDKVSSGSFFTPDYRTAFTNQRQEAIFWHMIYSPSYPYLLPAYRNSQAFRDMVHTFTMPVGGNLLNSVRIDNIRQQINTIYMNRRLLETLDNNNNIGHFQKAQQRLVRQQQLNNSRNRLQNLREALDREDLEFLTDRTVSAPFWAYVATKLDNDDTEELYDFISGRQHTLWQQALLNWTYPRD